MPRGYRKHHGAFEKGHDDVAKVKDVVVARGQQPRGLGAGLNPLIDLHVAHSHAHNVARAEVRHGRDGRERILVGLLGQDGVEMSAARMLSTQHCALTTRKRRWRRGAATSGGLTNQIARASSL